MSRIWSFFLKTQKKAKFRIRKEWRNLQILLIGPRLQSPRCAANSKSALNILRMGPKFWKILKNWIETFSRSWHWLESFSPQKLLEAICPPFFCPKQNWAPRRMAKRKHRLCGRFFVSSQSQRSTNGWTMKLSCSPSLRPFLVPSSPLAARNRMSTSLTVSKRPGAAVGRCVAAEFREPKNVTNLGALRCPNRKGYSNCWVSFRDVKLFFCDTHRALFWPAVGLGFLAFEGRCSKALYSFLPAPPGHQTGGKMVVFNQSKPWMTKRI